MSVLPIDAGHVRAAEPDRSDDRGRVHSTLVGIVQKLLRLPDLRLTAATTYAEVPGWDSLSHINVIFEVEQTFGIRFNDEELEQLWKVGSMGEFEALVRRKLTAATPNDA